MMTKWIGVAVGRQGERERGELGNEIIIKDRASGGSPFVSVVNFVRN
jgi:hypothetical protein